MGSDSESLHAERAIALARSAVGSSPAGSVEAHPVDRLDRPGASYYLVLLPGATAAVDPVGEQVMTWARTARAPLEVEREQAVELAGLPPDATARLVWRSSAASRSPLYPFWEVEAGTEVTYVDQQRHVWRELPSGPAGG